MQEFAAMLKDKGIRVCRGQEMAAWWNSHGLPGHGFFK